MEPPIDRWLVRIALATALALGAGALQHLAVFLLAHALTALLYEGSHTSVTLADVGGGPDAEARDSGHNSEIVPPEAPALGVLYWGCECASRVQWTAPASGNSPSTNHELPLPARRGVWPVASPRA